MKLTNCGEFQYLVQGHYDAWNYTHDVANVEPYQGVLREVEVAAHGDADD